MKCISFTRSYSYGIFSRNSKQGKKYGKSLRKTLPRSHQGQWTFRANRTDKIQLIFDQEKNHVQDVIFLCHERIKASAFFRGADIIIASDMSELAMKTFQDSMHRYTLMSPSDVWMIIIVSK